MDLARPKGSTDFDLLHRDKEEERIELAQFIREREAESGTPDLTLAEYERWRRERRRSV